MSSRTIIAIVAVLFVVIILAVAISLRSPKTKVDTKGKAVAVVAPKTTVEVNDIIDSPLVYAGLSVEVDSQVSKWVTKKSFKVRTNAGSFGGGGEPLLVIRKDPFTLPQANTANSLGLGEKVRVHMKGRVTILNKEQLASALGVDLESDEFKQLDNDNLTTWRLKPVLLLDTAEKL